MQQINNKSLLSFMVTAADNAVAVTNPATGELVGHAPISSEPELMDAIERAHVAQKEWAKVPAKSRAVLLNRWYQLILENKDDLARIMTVEQGKPLAEAAGEVLYGASFIEWFAEEAKRTYGDSIPGPTADKRLVTIKQPIGVACAITPWNFPIAMITRKAGPALAAGCSFVVKPSDSTPLSAFAIVELAYQAGIPKDALQVVLGESSRKIGAIFTSHPLIRKLSFTGSTQVGSVLMQQAAKDIKRTSMELGGNAPFIVFDDADIDAAVQGAMASKFRNAGQTCVCANRFYVHSKVYDEFVTKFDAAVQQLKVGNGLDEGVNIGPVINESAKQGIQALIDRAVEQGAVPVTPLKQLDGLFMQPVVLKDVKHSMDIVQEEIFGPVAPVIRFDTDEELIEMANDTIYGLASYFYSQNIHRVWKVAEALEYGMVGINEGIISTEVAPFGGVKQSGIGREGAKQGIDEYMDVKYLCFGGN
ncbi:MULTISPECIES: NAD-dependent succinate-semialdehyde dehydrogenase [Vibrio]|jgi:succinate-semialdehyde dehydrogenase/glutarate-semialdehyde dehydrogenase|uniref:NAD-dependent succinate-semialdehyde dehydrogenase n=1 Tax=Vibrio mediterranei TaxID=689 RepID=A0A2S9ZS41_9VIBR|nr:MULTISPECIES: NAD-dependent succinate-semialdehyde dehydrogenase [Vibrio]AYV23470.1 NAD-dependent succinate-semialdehyde dehydrogenase [Vibrio mediterranei]EDL54685.1 succinate-semialdehyde dehydrogenase [Vibrio mediterranei AK1]MCF4172323.1 NAD-dependent succinate-semialdehyde dehydrogenase [Vibrio sp. McD22-P3]MCG9663922.1 NAD-dependent succinate-semialdehyde dehydrogenase [Vibrio mediterranei]MCY9852134.1 NAD-dependent succinate-semialdehyde dehydrogenase [Vibrio mediterranei]